MAERFEQRTTVALRRAMRLRNALRSMTVDTTNEVRGLQKGLEYNEEGTHIVETLAAQWAKGTGDAMLLPKFEITTHYSVTEAEKIELAKEGLAHNNPAIEKVITKTPSRAELVYNYGMAEHKLVTDLSPTGTIINPSVESTLGGNEQDRNSKIAHTLANRLSEFLEDISFN